MSAADLLRILRQRGYAVGLDAGALVVHRATPPPAAARAAATLREHRAAIVRLLEVEAHPAVCRVLEVFPTARLVRVEDANGKVVA